MTSRHRSRRRYRRCGLTVAVALSLAGCGGTQAATTSHADRLSLSGCVTRWNRAALGQGKSLSAAIAAGWGGKALMFESANGICGLAFPERVSSQSYQPGTFISLLGGDYVMEKSPLEGGIATMRSLSKRLEMLAEKSTNVHVRARDGQIRVSSNHGISPLRIAALPVSSTCNRVDVPPIRSADAAGTGIYEVGRRTVGCVRVRVLAWAWQADQEISAQAGKTITEARVDGWTCAQATESTGENAISVKCSDGAGLVELRSVRLRTNVSVGPRAG